MATVTCPGCQERDAGIAALERHVCPGSAVSGPLALARAGDLSELDMPARVLNVLVAGDELSRRRAAWVPPAPRFSRGYGKLYCERVLQADQGCDFDFLRGSG